MKKLIFLSVLSLSITSCGNSRLPEVDTRINETIDDKLQSLGGQLVTGNLKTQGLSNTISMLIAHKSQFAQLEPSGVDALFVESPACVKYSGDPKDWDGDGIGRDYTATFNCIYASKSGNMILTGSYRIRDVNDNDARSGFGRDVSNMRFQNKVTNEVYQLTESFSINPTSGYQQYSGSTTSTEIIGGLASTSETSIGYIPTTVSTPFSRGQLIIDGNAIIAQKSGNSASVSYYTDGVTVTNQCGNSKYIENGVINYSYGATDDQKNAMIYSNCNGGF